MQLPRIVGRQPADPGIERPLHGSRIALAELAFGQIAQAIFGAFEDIEESGDWSAGDLGWLVRGGGHSPPYGSDPPDAAGVAVAALVAKRILSVTLDRVVPVADE